MIHINTRFLLSFWVVDAAEAIRYAYGTTVTTFSPGIFFFFMKSLTNSISNIDFLGLIRIILRYWWFILVIIFSILTQVLIFFYWIWVTTAVIIRVRFWLLTTGGSERLKFTISFRKLHYNAINAFQNFQSYLLNLS